MMKRLCLLLVILLALPIVTTAQDTVFTGVVQTGINHLLGEASFDFPLSIPLMGEYVEGADEGNLLTTDTSTSAIVATFYDPLLETIGEPKPDVSLLNVPLRDVPVIIDDEGNRATLPDIFDGGIFSHSTIHADGPITLDMWLKAGGEMTIDCSMDEVHVSFNMRDLIPNGLYTAWVIVIFPDGSPGVLPFGGVPNAVNVDDEGNGTFHRVLNACPTDVGDDKPLLLWTTIAYHADGSIYGTRPSQPGLGYPDGTVLFDHVSFPVGVPLAGASD